MAVRKKKSDASGGDELKLKAAPAKPKQPLYLIYGDDDYLVAEEAKRVIASLTPKNASEFSVDTIEGMAANQSEAATIFKRLFEALQSQSFFATEKIVWWRSTNLLGSNSTASAAGVSDSLSGLDELIKAGLSNGTTLVITATDVDGRKTIAKTLQKIGTAISFKTDPYKQQENQAQAALFAREVASKEGKQLDRDVDLLIAEMAGGDSRTIHSEVEKLATYVGDRPSIQEEDVRSIGSWRPGGVIWDLPDAVGERNLNKALSVLDDLLFMGESSIALLFTVISRVRLLLLLSALTEKKVIRTGSDYNSFKSQLDKAPAWVSENLPADKKLNPLASHPFVLWKASSGVARYSRAELQKALETLLECNERMVSSGGDPRDTLKETLLKICMKS